MQKNADYDTRCKESQKWLTMLHFFCLLTFIGRGASLADHLDYWNEIKANGKREKHFLNKQRTKIKIKYRSQPVCFVQNMPA